MARAIFTPIDAETGERLCVPLAEVEVLQGDLYARGTPGPKGIVKIRGIVYLVNQIACGLRCFCDAEIVRVLPDNAPEEHNARRDAGYSKAAS